MSLTVRSPLTPSIKKFRGIARRAKDLAPIGPAVGDVVAAAMNEQFRSEGAYGGRPWAPLSAEYAARKRAAGFSGGTLVREGTMMRSLISRPMSIETYEGQELTFGTRSDVYPYHAFGTSKMPRREVLFAFEPMVTRMNRKIVSYVVDGVTG